MLGNGPVRFGGRPRGKGSSTTGHLAARPTQWHYVKRRRIFAARLAALTPQFSVSGERQYW